MFFKSLEISNAFLGVKIENQLLRRLVIKDVPLVDWVANNLTNALACYCIAQDKFGFRKEYVCRLSNAYFCREAAIQDNHKISDDCVEYCVAGYYTEGEAAAQDNHKITGDTTEKIIAFADRILTPYYEYPTIHYDNFTSQYPALSINRSKGGFIDSLNSTRSMQRMVDSCHYNNTEHYIDNKMMIFPLLPSFDASPVSYLLKVVRDHDSLLNLTDINDLIHATTKIHSHLGRFVFMYLRHPLLLQLITYGTYSLFNGPIQAAYLNIHSNLNRQRRLLYNVGKLIILENVPYTVKVLKAFDDTLLRDAQELGLYGPVFRMSVFSDAAQWFEEIVLEDTSDKYGYARARLLSTYHRR